VLGVLLEARPRPALGIRTAVALLALGVLAGVASPASATSPPLTWSSPRRIDTHGLLDIRCPTASLCVAIDSAGNVLTTKTPLAGAKGWKRAHVDNGLTALACPSAGLCVAVDSRGDVLTSKKPAGGPKTWTRTLVDTVSPGELTAVGCRSTLCVIGDTQGNAFVAKNPTGGRHAWKLIALPSNGDSPGSMSGFACPSKSLCVGVDQSTGEGFIDDVYTSTDPTASNRWNLTTELTDNWFTGVACPSTSLCVAPTATGAVMTATNPTHGSSWHASTLATVSINAVTCASVSFCLLGDESGAVWSSTHPTSGAAAWMSTKAAPKDAIESLACASARLCLAATRRGDVVVGSRK